MTTVVAAAAAMSRIQEDPQGGGGGLPTTASFDAADTIASGSNSHSSSSRKKSVQFKTSPTEPQSQHPTNIITNSIPTQIRYNTYHNDSYMHSDTNEELIVTSTNSHGLDFNVHNKTDVDVVTSPLNQSQLVPTHSSAITHHSHNNSNHLAGTSSNTDGRTAVPASIHSSTNSSKCHSNGSNSNSNSHHSSRTNKIGGSVKSSVNNSNGHRAAFSFGVIHFAGKKEKENRRRNISNNNNNNNMMDHHSGSTNPISTNHTNTGHKISKDKYSVKSKSGSTITSASKNPMTITSKSTGRGGRERGGSAVNGTEIIPTTSGHPPNRHEDATSSLPSFVQSHPRGNNNYSQSGAALLLSNPLQFQRHFMDILNRATRTRTLHSNVRTQVPNVIRLDYQNNNNNNSNGNNAYYLNDDLLSRSDAGNSDVSSITADSIFFEDHQFSDMQSQLHFMCLECGGSVDMSRLGRGGGGRNHLDTDSLRAEQQQDLDVSTTISAENSASCTCTECVYRKPQKLHKKRYRSLSQQLQLQDRYKENEDKLDNKPFNRNHQSSRERSLQYPPNQWVRFSPDIEENPDVQSILYDDYPNGNGVESFSNVMQRKDGKDSFATTAVTHEDIPAIDDYVVDNSNLETGGSHTETEDSQLQSIGESCDEEYDDETESTVMSTISYTYHASSDSKYETYAIHVDRTQEDRACEIAIFSFDRPHMRGFHLAWIGFFVGFFIWYAITPLLGEVQESLNLKKEDIWTSSIAGVTGTVIFRLMMGPFCDVYGARICMGMIILVASIPVGLVGLCNNLFSLSICRGIISIAGSAFVMCQYWTTIMFTKEVAGTANALAAGWGNLGGGLTQIIMGSVFFPIFKTSYLHIHDFDHDDEELSEAEAADFAWRTVCIAPAVAAFFFGILCIKYGDDSPKGNYHKLKKLGYIQDTNIGMSMRAAAADANTWLLSLQYACCFGVELTVNNAAALYFQDEFGQSTESAAAIASAFGLMNIFARGMGGLFSDVGNAALGMRGRLIWQCAVLVIEGFLVCVFAYMETLSGAVILMALFSIFVQAAEGSTFGIVPYVNPPCTGSIAGIVGAGGTAGAIVFGFIFREFDYKTAFNTMGVIVMCSSVLSLLVVIRGHAGLVCGVDAPELRVMNTGGWNHDSTHMNNNGDNDGNENHGNDGECVDGEKGHGGRGIDHNSSAHAIKNNNNINVNENYGMIDSNRRVVTSNLRRDHLYENTTTLAVAGNSDRRKRRSKNYRTKVLRKEEENKTQQNQMTRHSRRSFTSQQRRVSHASFDDDKGGANQSLSSSDHKVIASWLSNTRTSLKLDNRKMRSKSSLSLSSREGGEERSETYEQKTNPFNDNEGAEEDSSSMYTSSVIGIDSNNNSNNIDDSQSTNNSSTVYSWMGDRGRGGSDRERRRKEKALTFRAHDERHPRSRRFGERAIYGIDKNNDDAGNDDKNVDSNEEKNDDYNSSSKMYTLGPDSSRFYHHL